MEDSPFKLAHSMTNCFRNNSRQSKLISELILDSLFLVALRAWPSFQSMDLYPRVSSMPRKHVKPAFKYEEEKSYRSSRFSEISFVSVHFE